MSTPKSKWSFAGVTDMKKLQFGRIGKRRLLASQNSRDTTVLSRTVLQGKKKSGGRKSRSTNEYENIPRLNI
jgi:hypothetical protein